MNNALEGLRGLVVEDDYFVLVSVKQVLLEAGCKSITSAGTLNDALELIESQTFDFATIDLNLNGQTAYPIATALAARGVPFCFATGYNDPALRGEYGELPVLIKPYGVAKLAAVITGMLASRAPIPSVDPGSLGV